MEDDLISALTHEVKEEVIENYLRERRLIELQIEDLMEQVKQVQTLAQQTGVRFARLGYLMIHQDMLERLKHMLALDEHLYWSQHLGGRFFGRLRFIRVSGLRAKVRFKKLVLEAYHRLYQWMGKYLKGHQRLENECRALNLNITHFQKNFDLLTILSFLKSLDTSLIERKYVMGENFTAEEMASIDQKLYIRPIDMGKLGVPPPMDLPKPETLEERLSAMANEIFGKYQDEAKGLMQ
jgi:hypothetical protein